MEKKIIKGINIDSEYAQKVQQLVDSGKFKSFSEAIRCMIKYYLKAQKQKAQKQKSPKQKAPTARVVKESTPTGKLFYTKKEVAQILGIHERTVDFYRTQHGLPTIKLEHLTRYPIAAFNEWLKQFYDKGVPSLIRGGE